MKESLQSLITWPNGQDSERLIEALEGLEQHMANLHALSGSPNKDMTAASEVTRLRRENRELKTRQDSALTRLDSLIAQLEPLMEDEAPATSATTSQVAA